MTFGCVVFAAVGVASAQLIPSQAGTASSELGAPFNRFAVHAADGSGLSAGDNFAFTPDQTHSDAPSDTMWLSTGNFLGGIDPDPTYTVTFDNLYNVSGFRVFNYNEAGETDRGVQLTNILVSLDGVNFTPLLNNVIFAQASGLPTYTGQYFDLVSLTGGVVSALSFRFDIQSDYGDAQTFYGLSELQFDGVIPEPSSSALMGIAGIAFLLILWRRKTGAFLVH